MMEHPDCIEMSPKGIAMKCHKHDFAELAGTTCNLAYDSKPVMGSW
jgi:hypothetical protein